MVVLTIMMASLLCEHVCVQMLREALWVSYPVLMTSLNDRGYCPHSTDKKIKAELPKVSELGVVDKGRFCSPPVDF